MRKPVPFLKDEDLEKGLDDLADGAADFLAAGLCCPDDLLDDVMDCFVAPTVDDGFLEALGLGGGGGGGGCSPPRLENGRPGDGDGGGLKDLLDVVSAPMLAAANVTPDCADLPPYRGVLDDFKDMDFDVDMFFADDAGCGVGDSNVSRPAPVTAALPAAAGPANSCGAVNGVVHDRAPTWPARGPDVTSGALNGVTPDSASPRNTADVFGALDGVIVPYRAPPLPARGPAYAYCGAQDGFTTDSVPPALLALDAVPAWPSTASSTSSSGCLSSMTWETESPARVSPPRAWVVPRKKKRHQPITRRNHFWLPKSHPYLLPANAPPRDTNNPPILKSAGDSTDSGSGNSAAGVRLLQRPKAVATAAPRQRNRQRQRACTHCSNTETPQWRAGPRGPGTLCNACGIRFKNGKLFEEYRPSTSPSFESDKHSNRHRKVVKLRERKALLSRVPDDDDDKKTVLALPPQPPPCTGGEFMDVCTYIATG